MPEFPQYVLTQLAGIVTVLSGIIYLALGAAAPMMQAPRGVKAATIAAMVVSFWAHLLLGFVFYQATPRASYSWFEWLVVFSMVAQTVALNFLAGMTFLWIWKRKHSRGDAS